MASIKEEDVTIFAKTDYRNEEKSFGIKPDDRRRHMYLIGKTGMGKSAMLRNLVIQDIKKGRGVAFVDPHGDTAEEIMHFIPKDRVNDVVYFNPADLEYPVAFNILEAVDEDHKHLIASGMMGVFKKIWPDVWSPRMEYILNNTILALLDYPGSTMLGINRMMSEKEFRSQVIEKVKDPIVRSFWLEEFGKWDQRFAREATAAIQNKVGQFISTPIVRHIVGQTKSTINMRQIMDEGKILIVNLSKGKIGEESMALLGGMVVTRLYLAAMERVDIAEGTRRDFYLYVDEFQNFATESFASILSEARKYRLNLTVAHQYIAQLDEQVRDAVFGNVGTLITFRVGAADAEFLEKEFEPAVMMNDIINLPKYQIYLKLMIDGVSGDAFSAKSLPPFEAPVVSYVEKAIQVSRERYSHPRKEVEEKISKWMSRNFGLTEEEMKQEKMGESVEAESSYLSAGVNNYSSEKIGTESSHVVSTTNYPLSDEKNENLSEYSSSDKFMSPSQIVGFSDQESDGIEAEIKQQMEDSLSAANAKEELAEEIASETVEETTEDKNKKKAENEKEEKKVELQESPVIDLGEKKPTIWHEATCDRCGKKTKIPFKPEADRGVYCKDCLREIRRQRALENQRKTNESTDSKSEPNTNLRTHSTPKAPPAPPSKYVSKISEEQKMKYKEDLRKMLAELKNK